MAAKNKQMDFSRPYGEIFGQIDDAVGARYQQDNILYDASGNFVKALDNDSIDHDVAEANEQAFETNSVGVPVAPPVPNPASVEPPEPEDMEEAGDPAKSQLPKAPVLPKATAKKK